METLEILISTTNEILQNKFHNGEKTKIKAHKDRLNIACPFCGDSHTDASKKRGNLYLTTNTYKCYNCGYSTSIKDFFAKSKEYGFAETIPNEIYKLQTHFKTTRHSYSGNLKISSIFTNIESILESYAFDIEDIKMRLGLVDVRGTYGDRYLRSRHIDVLDFENFLFDKKFNRLVILNQHKETKKVIAIQFRNFNPKYEKYMTYKLSKIYQYLKMDIPETEDFSNLDDISIFFNFLNCDFGKNITVFEGFIDSLFVSNSFCISSARNRSPIDLQNIRYLLDYDETGRDAMRKLLKSKKTVFMWEKLLKDNGINWDRNKKLDMNGLVLFLDSLDNPKPININKYFTDNILDFIYV